MIITNAKDKGLNFSGLPQVGGVLPGWFQPLEFEIVTKTLVNYEVQEIIIEISTQGVRQPMMAQKIAIKPEGQRAWKWETLHCLPDVPLKVDDEVIFGGKTYRVMNKWDWTEYGYCEYEICQGYEKVGEES